MMPLVGPTALHGFYKDPERRTLIGRRGANAKTFSTSFADVECDPRGSPPTGRSRRSVPRALVSHCSYRSPLGFVLRNRVLGFRPSRSGVMSRRPALASTAPRRVGESRIASLRSSPRSGLITKAHKDELCGTSRDPRSRAEGRAESVRTDTSEESRGGEEVARARARAEHA